MAKQRSKLVKRSVVEVIRGAMSETWERKGHLHPDKMLIMLIPHNPLGGQFAAADVDRAACSLPYVKSVERYRATPEIPFSGWLVKFKLANTVKTDG